MKRQSAWLTIFISVILSLGASTFGGALSKGLWQTTNDTMRVGGPSSDDVKIIATTGSGTADPALRVNKTSKVWQFANNGVSFVNVADTTNSVQITGAQTIAGDKTFSNSVSIDPANLTNAHATILGFKQYYHGTTYNGGNAPTITLSGVTLAGTVNGTFVPYKMQDGVWRMRFNMRISPTNATAISGNSFNIIVNGVTYKNTSGFGQAVTGATSTATNIIYTTYTAPGTSNITTKFSTAANYNSTDYFFSGDVELDSNPTWAY